MCAKGLQSVDDMRCNLALHLRWDGYATRIRGADFAFEELKLHRIQQGDPEKSAHRIEELLWLTCEVVVEADENLLGWEVPIPSVKNTHKVLPHLASTGDLLREHLGRIGPCAFDRVARKQHDLERETSAPCR